ncbi:hypothetical protein WJX84_002711 [Apatococcus fuscideae]|uniref:serine O-acetyltransferase n=1 Tax=Apatococcus fuscideae TaxID=2026836 RepID=A0AAW1TIT2_9CHLO
MAQTLIPVGLTPSAGRGVVRPTRKRNPVAPVASQPLLDRQHLWRLRASSNAGGVEDPETTRINQDWQQAAFPGYLQNGTDDFCQAWEEALQAEERRQSKQAHHGVGKKASAVTRENPVWRAMRSETRAEAAKEPLLSSFLYASILSHDTFARSLAFVLANRLSDATMLATELFELFHTLLRDNEEVEQAALADVIAVRERDPACCMYSSALLFYKGYHALETHRIAHTLWHRNQRVMARTLQSRVSEVCAIDIHPAARIGKGILLDHGTGVVIGETAIIGENVSIMQNVTLGGTGKAGGDRHPKIQNNVLIGASATVLGNIVVGKGAQVAAGSMVLKDVPPRTMVAGSPAKIVGCVSGNPAEQMQHCPSASIPVSEGDDGPFCANWDSAVQGQPTRDTPELISSSRTSAGQNGVTTSQPPPSISTDHRASPNRRVRPDLVPPSTPARVNGTPVNGFPVNGVASKGVRPFGRLAPDIGSGASEAAQNLAPEQNKTAHQSQQQQQQLSDQARAGLARMNSSANAAQEGTWVDTSPTSNSPRGQAPTDGYEARASAVASSQSGPEQPQQAKPETLQSSSDSSGEAADKPTAGALTAVTAEADARSKASHKQRHQVLLDYSI